MSTPQLQLTPCRISTKDVTNVQVSLAKHTSENQLPDPVNTMTLLVSCGTASAQYGKVYESHASTSG